MAIKSSTFGRVELSGKDAARFVQHMNEDKANPLALAALIYCRVTPAFFCLNCWQLLRVFMAFYFQLQRECNVAP